jgi:hypothetical protein
MIKATIHVLERMGARMSDVYASLENRMKCGVGKCGRCLSGDPEHYWLITGGNAARHLDIDLE